MEKIEKKFGAYPGSLKDSIDYLLNCSEEEMFELIKSKTEYVNILHGADYEYNEIKEEEYALDYAITIAAQRFGFNIIIPENNEKERIIKTDSFKEWWHKQMVLNHVNKNNPTINR